MNEKILVVESSKVLFIEEGYTRLSQTNYLEKIRIMSCIEQNLLTMFRDEVEGNDKYRQIIVYPIIKNYKGEYFSATRTNKSGELRLHDKVSIGFGGHMNPIRNETNNTFDPTLKVNAARELEEELNISYNNLKIIGVINDTSDEVGREHLGIVILTIQDDVSIKQDCNKEGKYLPKKTLLNLNIENWSRIVLENIDNCNVINDDYFNDMGGY